MMKHLLAVLLFLLLPMLIYANGNVSASDTINQRVNGKKSGYWRKKRLNGTLKWEGYYVNGERTGSWKFYSKEGHYMQGRLEDGKRMGWWYYTAPDGTKLDGSNWKEGNCIGRATMSW